MSNRFLALEERWRSYRRALYLRFGARAFLGIALICAVYFGVEGLFFEDGVFSRQEIPAKVAANPVQKNTNNSSQDTPNTQNIIETPMQGQSSAQDFPQDSASNNMEIKQSPSVAPEQSVAEVNKEDESCFIVKAMILNIREEPKLGAKVLSRYVRGDKICARTIQKDWIHSGIGWVNNSKDILTPLPKKSHTLVQNVSEVKEISAPTMITSGASSLKRSSATSGRASKTKEKASSTPSKRQKMSRESKPAVSESVDDRINAFRLSSVPSSPKEMRAFQLERYNREPSYDPAIELARGYYAERDFAHAREWALVANNHQRTSVESWSIFAKSLYFSGNKDEAIRVLERYKDFDTSGALSRLIERMRIDKLKE